MRKVILALIIVLIGSGFSYTTSEAKKKAKVTIKIATIAPKGSSMVNILNEFRDEVRKETSNEVDFKIYYGGVQGDGLDVLRKIRLKQLHGGFFTGRELGQIVPSVRVNEIPFMFKNRYEASYVRTELEDTMNKYFEDQGYVVLGWTDIGLVYIFSKEPITSVEVLRKQKVWVWGNDPLITPAFKAIGVTPIPLSISDVMTSLSANIIDTAPNTPFGAVAFRWHTKFKSMSDIPGGPVVGAGVVTREIWDKISPESQKMIKKIGKNYFDKLTEDCIEADKKSIELLKNAGIKITPFMNSEAGRKYLMEMGKKARESAVGKLYSRELLERTLALLKEYRKNHPNSTYLKIE